MNNITNLFEYATREELRFPSKKGDLSTEQLWKVKLRSIDGFDLEAIAQEVNKQYENSTQKRFVTNEPKTENIKAKAKLDIVVYIIETKMREEAETKKRAENNQKLQTLFAALANKEQAKISGMSEEELRAEITKLSN